MKKISLIGLSAIIIFSACNSETKKKVIVMGKGDMTVNELNVTLKEGSGYIDKTVEVKDDKAVALNIETPDGKKNPNIPEGTGVFLLNLRTDTIVGARQLLGNLSSGKTITQEELKVMIDSLNQLTTGANVKPGGQNFIVLPGQLTKVSSDADARVYGPFTKIPGSIDAGKNGKEPEIYKFYTNNEMRDLIKNLKKNTF